MWRFLRKHITIYRCTQLLYLLVSASVFASNLNSGNPLKMTYGPATFAFLFVPWLAEKLLRTKLGDPLKTMTLLFCCLAYNLGVALRWYDDVQFYDDFAHLLSGVFFTLLGICLYVRARKQPVAPAVEWIAQMTYGFYFSMFIAVLWEIGEFHVFLITGHDAQHTLTTGVFDTMEDLISCFIGSVIMALDYILHAKKGLRSPLIRAYERFVADNNLPREEVASPEEA